MDTPTKISANRQKKIEIVAGLNEKLASAKAIVFTNYTGLTHKQLEGLKKAIKPLKAEFVVAKNTLVLRAMEENKIKVGDDMQFEGPTGTLLMHDDVVGPLKSLAKLIKELGIPSVKFGIMDGDTLTGEEILKISTLPGKEVLLTQVVISLKSPIFGLHRALNWNLQKLVMTLGAIAKSKSHGQSPLDDTPADAPVAEAPAPEPTPAASDSAAAPGAEEPKVEPQTSAVDAAPATELEPEPETILAETAEEKKAEEPNESTQKPEEVN